MKDWDESDDPGRSPNWWLRAEAALVLLGMLIVFGNLVAPPFAT